MYLTTDARSVNYYVEVDGPPAARSSQNDIVDKALIMR